MGGIARVQREELERFNRFWDDLYKAFPAARAAAVAAAGKAVKEELDAQILSQGVDDMFGHIRNTQTLRLGSLGGYAAVSPQARPMTDRFGRTKTWKGKQASARQVTKWLERGHAAREGTSLPRWSDKLRSGFGKRNGAARSFDVVRGRQFYSFTKLKAWDLARKAASEVLSQIAEEVDY